MAGLAAAAWTAGTLATRAHRRVEATRALERYARSRGHPFVPGRSPQVRAVEGDATLVVDLHRLGGALHTRVATDAHGGELSVVQRRSYAAGPSAHLAVAPLFDAAYAIARGGAGAHELLAPIADDLVRLDVRSGVWLRVDGGRAALSWRGVHGVETDPLLLDAAIGIVARLAGARAAGPYR